MTSQGTLRETMLAILDAGSFVRVTLDARDPAVNVPAHLRRSAELVLEYGSDMPVPIPDLHIGEAGIAATLSFNREPVPTFVPWAAVLSLKASPAAPREPVLSCVLCERSRQHVSKLLKGGRGCVCIDCAVQAIAVVAASSNEQPLDYWLTRLADETHAIRGDER